ncbi:hypothetical protein Tco_0068141 [Tanacetum coccineum]
MVAKPGWQPARLVVDGDEVMTRVMRRWWCDWRIGGGVVTEMKLMVTIVVQLRLSRGGGDSDVVVRRWRGMNGGEVNVGSAVVE